MDWSSVGVQAVLALTTTLTMVIVWGLKLAWGKVPASLVIFATPVLGIAVNFALSYLAGHPPASPMVAALLGVLAISLREFLSTLATKGLNGPITVTKGSL